MRAGRPDLIRGRLAVHALSAATELRGVLPAGRLCARPRCLGAALCAVRMPAFRAPSASVDYEFLVAIARD